MTDLLYDPSMAKGKITVTEMAKKLGINPHKALKKVRDDRSSSPWVRQTIDIKNLREGTDEFEYIVRLIGGYSDKANYLLMSEDEKTAYHIAASNASTGIDQVDDYPSARDAFIAYEQNMFDTSDECGVEPLSRIYYEMWEKAGYDISKF